MADEPPCPRPDDLLRSCAKSYLDDEWIAQSGPLAVLRTSYPMRESLRQYEQRLITAAREQGASWDDIGKSLHITRQTAHKRFAHLDR